MIGPHEGKELELMLAGKKYLAMFHDALQPGQDIAEEVIPENMFAPYVRDGRMLRFSEDITMEKSGDVIRYVCFTTPEESWRAQFLLWLKRDLCSGAIEHDPAHDAIIGRLLGYDESDIQDFLQR